MRKIEAIIETSELPELREALREVGVRTIRVSEAELVPVFAGGSGSRHEADDEREWKSGVSMVVPDEAADRVVLTLLATVKGGGIDDGKKFVSSIEYVVRLEATGFFDDVL